MLLEKNKNRFSDEQTYLSFAIFTFFIIYVYNNKY